MHQPAAGKPTCELMADAGTDMFGAGDPIPTHAETSGTEVDRALVHAKLQKLGKTLLRRLFGVPVSAYAVLLDQQQHFQSWLESLSEQDQRIFTLIDQSMFSLTDLPFTSTQIYAYETGITVGRLAGVVKSLFCETKADKVVLRSARLVVHTLNVGDVLNLLALPDVEATLGKEPCANVRALVIAILRKYIPPPHHPQLSTAFKYLVWEFRQQLDTSTFLVRIEREWGPAYEAAAVQAVVERARKKGILLIDANEAMAEVCSFVFMCPTPHL